MAEVSAVRSARPDGGRAPDQGPVAQVPTAATATPHPPMPGDAQVQATVPAPTRASAPAPAAVSTPDAARGAGRTGSARCVAGPAPSVWWEPALTPGQARPEGRPDWAAFTEAAVAAAPVRAVVPKTAYPGLSGFGLVLAPFADRALVRMSATLRPAAAPPGPAAHADRSTTDQRTTDRGPGGHDSPGDRTAPADLAVLLDLPALRAAFTAGLTERLARIAARTLVLELHTARAAGRLRGGTPQERFRSFVALTARRDGLAALLRTYPVLARLLARTSLDAADAHAELLNRLLADRPLLVSGLLRGTDPGPLVAVDTEAGDRHRHGRAVAVLHFADGASVVHRPRPPAAHRHFNALLGWYNAQPGVPRLRTLGLVDRGGYGWTEFAEFRPCRTGFEVERFYRRQGALLALLHVLDGTDMHVENVVACADQPVLVDVETLFHPPSQAGPAVDPAARALEESVHRVGLLPQLLLGDAGAVDVSGIGGGLRTSSPVEGVDWAGAGTDEMRLVRRARPFREARNRPRLDGAAVDPADHTEALVAGFRAGYTALADGRDDLTGPRGLLHAFAEDEVRVVPRATRVYARLLDESTHPDLLRDAADRGAVLDLLRTDAVDDPGRPGLADHELADLWAGDVPLFTARPGGRDLWTADGRRLPGELAETGLARAETKLAALGGVDRKDQEWIVRAAMACGAAVPAHRPGRPAQENLWATAPEPERLLAAARGVGDQLVAAAYGGRARTNWLGLELLADRYWRVRPLGADLAGGYTGTALFLAQLAALTGSDRYAEVARRALAPVPGLLDTLAAHPDRPAAVGSGGFAGLGGIAYALTEIARTLDDPLIRQWCEPAVALTAAAAARETDTGVHSGTAGGLAALLAVHAATGRPEPLRAAADCAALLAAAPAPAGTGFAHGAAGTGWALLRYAEAAGEPSDGPHRAAGLAALRAATAVRARESSWCRGRPGIALAVADSPTALADRPLAEWLQRAARNTARAAGLPDHSLCHGELGVLELLGHGGPVPGRTPWVRRAGALLAGLDQDGPRCGSPDHVPHPGLLTGLAGIGHGLLRLGYPERVPPALLLRPGAPADPPARPPAR
ncbi:type 2 lanthipeptide synthetase LanM family protein [Kitasatospora sp. CM 4170]|uniref:type 2 lanthipeptide synthetase LanM family protein n=1 Tax=Kitasatospora TaxID=2063 RepID=UPI0028A65EDE|nr:type 2 lanthipeptide synthetase LanM family protein [Kitasatospora sp. CM 4170]WNM44202.1 type 2 lanthipeptide synthetase LanM family protein [Kitasatospora sp. CM 4170]